MPNNYKSAAQFADRLWAGATNIYAPVREIAWAAKRRTLPISECTLCGVVWGLVIIRHWDLDLFRWLGVAFIYPAHPVIYWPYCFAALTSGFWVWGFAQVGKRRKLIKELTEVLTDCGLRSPSGRLPGFVSDFAIDDCTRKLLLSRTNLPLDAFKKAQAALESSLCIYIDEVREIRGKGLVEYIYSYSPMDVLVPLDDIAGIPSWSFVVGKTRSKRIFADLREVPHLMIAGQTGGGKSTFLRQLITTLYLNNPTCTMSLIDLKGGLEFQLFENLKGIEVVPSVDRAVSILQHLSQKLDHRLKLLKENSCKDLESYLKVPVEKRKQAAGGPICLELDRHVLVIDEAAEMFLAGHHGNSKDIQTARKVMSQIARQGRSVGVHLIIATQRPDAKAVDPQVKANLPGVLSFQMVNDASSITVLGNGRATDLPPIPGRGIWKCGSEMVEVQTPYLTPEEVDRLLEEKRTKPNEKTGSYEQITPNEIPPTQNEATV